MMAVLGDVSDGFEVYVEPGLPWPLIDVPHRRGMSPR
jgi:hypothetical protein